MNIEIPEALADRIKTYCEKNSSNIQEFIFDAIIEKLERSNQEKRRKPRM